MKKVRKLTSSTLKRIIAEERQKLETEENKDNASVLQELALLLKIKRAQKKRILEVKKLHEARTRLKKIITERI